MEYARLVDDEATPDPETGRVVEDMLGPTALIRGFSVRRVRTPPGGGSPRGVHTHPFDQAFYLLSGQMHFEVAGKRFTAESGCLIKFPRGVAHRSWTTGTETVVHLVIESRD